MADEAEHAAGDLSSAGKGGGDTAGPGCGNLSFAPATPVTLADGRLTPITSLRVGDQVRAFDAVTGTASAQTVQATWVHQDTDLLEVTLRTTTSTTTPTTSTTSTPTKAQRVAVASHGSQAPPPTTTARPATPTSTRDETIRTTANHPWLTADRGWAQAGSLTLGERVVRADGSTATVVALHNVSGTAPMYDLTVANLHDFAVGTGAYVVHNCGGGNDLSKAVQQARIAAKDKAGNYAAALLDDESTIVARSNIERHAEEGLIDEAASRGRSIVALYSEREPCAATCAPLLQKLGITNVTWTWAWNAVDAGDRGAIRAATNAAMKTAIRGLFGLQ